jgi:segregation and condensation protein B
VQITEKFYQHFEIDQLPQLLAKGATPDSVDDGDHEDDEDADDGSTFEPEEHDAP